MLQQAIDLKEEGSALRAILDNLDTDDWTRETPFKSWTVNNVVQHLHGTDKLAVMALQQPEEFAALKENRALLHATIEVVLEGAELRDAWWDYYLELCALLAERDPKQRVPWVGPDMSTMMFATARQMETWAHGQDILDLLGQTRLNTDRLKNIAVIGVKTFGWTFANRGLATPGPAPYVRLTGPSGQIWEFNERDDTNLVEGDAVEFCHVVTQGRNIADVNLRVVGAVASEWMRIAQCFAGTPKEPPAPGSRTVNFVRG